MTSTVSEAADEEEMSEISETLVMYKACIFAITILCFGPQICQNSVKYYKYIMSTLDSLLAISLIRVSKVLLPMLV